MTGRTIGPTIAAENKTWAIGIPLTRLFCAPQKRTVASSAVLKCRRRLLQMHQPMEQAKMSAQTANKPSIAVHGICCHSPAITAPLKAV